VSATPTVTVAGLGSLARRDLSGDAFTAQLVINRRLAPGRHRRITACAVDIHQCGHAVDNAVNTGQSTSRRSRSVTYQCPLRALPRAIYRYWYLRSPAVLRTARHQPPQNLGMCGFRPALFPEMRDTALRPSRFTYTRASSGSSLGGDDVALLGGSHWGQGMASHPRSEGSPGLTSWFPDQPPEMSLPDRLVRSWLPRSRSRTRSRSARPDTPPFPLHPASRQPPSVLASPRTTRILATLNGSGTGELRNRSPRALERLSSPS